MSGDPLGFWREMSAGPTASGRRKLVLDRRPATLFAVTPGSCLPKSHTSLPSFLGLLIRVWQGDLQQVTCRAKHVVTAGQ